MKDAMTKILLIDDDVELADMLRDYLQQEGFAVEVAHDGEQGAASAMSHAPALVVLDSMLPRLSGVEVLRRIRQHSAVPVLMLTARGSDVDRIVGLELGADDYVPKPCSARELVARIRAILRRVQAPAQPQPVASTELISGALALWPEHLRAECNGRALALTGTEFQILELLLRNAGRTVSKQALSETALGRPLARFDRSIDTHISNIRQKIAALAGNPGCIRTVYKAGYQLLKD
jgi:two-component system response regulator CpxR